MFSIKNKTKKVGFENISEERNVLIDKNVIMVNYNKLQCLIIMR